MITPEKIYLIDMGDEVTWCDSPSPSPDIDDSDVVVYIKAGSPFLTKKHQGMRIDYSGILGRIAGGCKVRQDQRYMLGQMEKHLEEMAERFYNGDISVVDEFLQLYCLDDHRPEVK